MRRLPWILATVTTALLALPAEAANLKRWHFDQTTNNIEFSTDVRVQPRAQLIFNPTRVVVDLPSTKLGRPKVQQSGRGAIRQLRLGQFDRQTTRLVVELKEGWTLDPAQVKVKGQSKTDWVIELPDPQRESNTIAASTAIPTSSGGGGSSSTSADQELVQNPAARDIAQNPVAQNPVAQNPVAQTTPSLNPGTSTPFLGQILQVRSTADGLFVKTEGQIEKTEIIRSRDRRQIELKIPNASLRGAIRLPTQAELYRLGIESMGAITLPARANRPTTTTITLNVPADAVDWRASRSGQSGIILLPTAKPKPITTAATPGRPGSGNIPIQAPPGNSSSSLPPGAELITVTLPPGPLPGSQTTTLPPTWTPPIFNGRPLVVIDPGHGGPDPGAVGRGGLRETDINLDIARKLAQRLEAAGIQTMLTRNGEYDLDLPPRVAMAERANATVFVSIHSNAINMSRPDVNGVETYYYSSGKGLASVIHRNILNRTASGDRGVRKARFYVLKRTSMPAVLVETGFVTGAQDAIKLSNPTFRSQMATAIAYGIREYLGR